MANLEEHLTETTNGDHQTMGIVPMLDVHRGKPLRLQVKVAVPTADHPNYNFVGKLLGPKGNSLKWLQERTQTKMAILGKGSMRNKEKENELRQLADSKYSHLHEDLHVEITAYAPAPEAYLRISNALFEIKRFLVPDYYDDIRQQQLRELGVISSDVTSEPNNTFLPFNSHCEAACPTNFHLAMKGVRNDSNRLSPLSPQHPVTPELVDSTAIQPPPAQPPIIWQTPTEPSSSALMLDSQRTLHTGPLTMRNSVKSSRPHWNQSKPYARSLPFTTLS